MTRSLGTNTALEVVKETATIVHLVELQLSVPIYLCDSSVDVTWNGITWEAVGGLLEWSGVEETVDMKGQGIQMQLSGVDQSILASLLTENRIGDLLIIRRAWLSTSGTIIDGTPTEIFRGYMNEAWEVRSKRVQDHSHPTVTISTRVVSRLVQLSQYRGMRSNVDNYRHVTGFTTDLFFQHVGHLPGRRVLWPAASYWDK